MTRHQLCGSLVANFDIACRKFSPFDVDCLISHIEAEYPEIESDNLSTIMRDNPFELIEILGILARRKTFKGTCPVCKDWQ